MVTPALGPSLGVAPSGTCRCSRVSPKNWLSGCSFSRNTLGVVIVIVMDEMDDRVPGIGAPYLDALLHDIPKVTSQLHSSTATGLSVCIIVKTTITITIVKTAFETSVKLAIRIRASGLKMTIRIIVSRYTKV